MGWGFFSNDFKQRVRETENGTCVETFGIDAWVLDESVVGSKDKSIRVNEEELAI
jgi:hypothetical protein